MIAAFDRPGVLIVLAAVPLLWAWLRRADRSRTRRLAVFTGRRGGRLARGFDADLRAWRAVLFAGATAAVVVALAGPRGGFTQDAPVPSGADVVVALDVSRSMLARDVDPDRLERARREVAALAAATRGDRLALVVFAGEARLLVPLTRDTATFASLLETVDPLAVGRGGTDLGAAIERAAAALPAERGRHGAIVLLTDGDDHAGGGRRAAARCAEHGTRVHVVGLGSERGAKIPLSSGAGDSGFLRDGEGREVVARRDATTLAAVARAGGGDLVALGPAPGDLAALLERRIRPAARAAAESGGGRSRKPLHTWPLLAALVLFLGDLCAVRSKRS